MESVPTFHDDNFCKFHELYVCTGDACALETRRRFLTKGGKKKERKKETKESQNFNPGLIVCVTRAETGCELFTGMEECFHCDADRFR